MDFSKFCHEERQNFMCKTETIIQDAVSLISSPLAI